jgi:hypothetical protein
MNVDDVRLKLSNQPPDRNRQRQQARYPPASAAEHPNGRSINRKVIGMPFGHQHQSRSGLAADHRNDVVDVCCRPTAQGFRDVKHPKRFWHKYVLQGLLKLN